jgi:hypothetical protein
MKTPLELLLENQPPGVQRLLRPSPVVFKHGAAGTENPHQMRRWAEQQRYLARYLAALNPQITEDNFVQWHRLPDGRRVKITVQGGVERWWIEGQSETEGLQPQPQEIAFCLEHGLATSGGSIHVGSALASYASSIGTTLGESPDEWVGHIWGEASAGAIACALGAFLDFDGPPELESGAYASRATDVQQTDYWSGFTSWYRDPALHTGLLRALAQSWGPWRNVTELAVSTLDPGAWGVVRWVDDTGADPVVRYGLIQAHSSVGVRWWPLTLQANQAAALACYGAILADPDEYDALTLRLVESAYMLGLEIADGAAATTLVSAAAYSAVVDGTPLAFGWAWSPQKYGSGSESVTRALMVGISGGGDDPVQAEVYDLAVAPSGSALSATVTGRGKVTWDTTPDTPLWRSTATLLTPSLYCPYPPWGEGEDIGPTPIYGWINDAGGDEFVEQLPRTSQDIAASVTTSGDLACDGQRTTVRKSARSRTTYGYVVAGTNYACETQSLHDVTVETYLNEELYTQELASFGRPFCNAAAYSADASAQLEAAKAEVGYCSNGDTLGYYQSFGTKREAKFSYANDVINETQGVETYQWAGLIVTGPDSVVVVRGGRNDASQSRTKTRANQAKVAQTEGRYSTSVTCQSSSQLDCPGCQSGWYTTSWHALSAAVPRNNGDIVVGDWASAASEYDMLARVHHPGGSEGMTTANDAGDYGAWIGALSVLGAICQNYPQRKVVVTAGGSVVYVDSPWGVLGSTESTGGHTGASVLMRGIGAA